MLWIISPAKKMREERDFLAPAGLPAFLNRTEALLDRLRAMPYGELKKLLACGDALASEAMERFHAMDLRRGLTPALLAYRGIQYQYLAPGVLEEGDYAFLQAHLRILSGFYGVLRPLDGVACYRLEMQAKLAGDWGRDLYGFWGDRLAAALAAETDVVLNLASEEYARAVRRHLPPGLRLVDVTFGERAGARLVEKGVYVKMARGEMVRFLTRRRAEDLGDVEAFDGLGYRLDGARSSADHLVFAREAPPGREK